jgi:hypothetical protein
LGTFGCGFNRFPFDSDEKTLDFDSIQGGFMGNPAKEMIGQEAYGGFKVVGRAGSDGSGHALWALQNAKGQQSIMRGFALRRLLDNKRKNEILYGR